MADEAPPPVFQISPKQKELMKLCREKRAVLVSGPRRSGKTLGAIHCVVDHAWRTDRANIVCVTVSQSAGLDSGIWPDLVNHVIPLWIESGIGMKWHRKPYIQNVTKKPTCEIVNAHGTVSVIQLDSLNDEDEVEIRYREKRYSMIYVNQLSNFYQQKTFRIWMQALRTLHLRADQMLLLGDTNPSEEGPRSWIWKLWYGLRMAAEGEYDQKLKALRDSLGLTEIAIHDNPFLSQADIDQLVADYADDPDLYARYILGEWRTASENAIFSKLFSEKRHCIGEIETPFNKDPDIMVPQADCWELITSWDPGSSANSAAVLMEKWVQITPDGKRLPPVFKLLDELVIVGKPHTIEEFVLAFQVKMRWWEERMQKKYHYTHWSDRSVFDMKDMMSAKFYHELVRSSSGGEIQLMAAGRGKGSILQRVDIFKRLLFENRIFFSNDKCPNCIQMCKSLMPGKTDSTPIAKGSDGKHIFDAMTYGIAEECYDELSTNAIRSMRKQEDEGISGLVSLVA